MKRTTTWRQLGRPKPDKVNREGFPAFRGTPEQELVNILMTGTTCNHFYASALQITSEFAKILGTYKDAEFQAKATVYARENGFLREVPIASTVALSNKLDRETFSVVAQRVCKNPKDWQKFIDIARSGVFRRGVGRRLKRELITAIGSLSPYHAMKYPQAVRDMIRIARPREDINPTVIRYIMKGEHSNDEQLQTLDKLKHSESDEEVARLVREGRLPYEVVTGAVPKMTPRIWEALFHVAPYFNLIRNLNNYGRNGVFKKQRNIDKAVERIANPEAIRKSMLFPFRFYIAHEMLENFRGADRIKSALREAIEISVENVPELDGKVCIASDVSGSMSSNMTGDYSVVQCNDVVGIFTAMLIRKCKNLPLILPFDTEIQWDIVEKVHKSETVMDIARCFDARGGTILAKPVEYLIEEKEDVDYFIAFTDNEEWAGRDFMSAWQEYTRKVAPECKAYLVTLKPYRDFPTPPNYPNVHYIFGWSDSVIRYITTRPEDQMKEIHSISL